METKPVVVVFGATGYQGGAVIKALLQTQRFHVRAVTRNPNSDPALLLKQKSVEVVAGDANEPSTLTGAFQGAWGAFLVTNFWDPKQEQNPDTDYIQGKNIVDAAVQSKSVQFVVWSALHDIEAASGGSLHVPHYTMKHKVEDYIRTSTKLNAAFVYAGFYMQNWINFPPFGVPVIDKDGLVSVNTAIRADVALPLIDIEEDFGKFVAPMFLNPDKFSGLDVLAATEYLTVPQMCRAYERVSGKKVQINPIDLATVPIPELRSTIDLINKLGYYLGESIQSSLARYPQEVFGNFERWLRRSQFQPHQLK